MADNQISVWSVVSTIGKGLALTVHVASQGVQATVDGVQKGASAVRDSMPVTEITAIFNTTDKIVRVMNKETPRDSREVLGQSAVSMKTEKTEGAWIPWFDPPLYDGFDRRHIAITIEDAPVIYIWQRGNFVYWTNKLDSEGKPAKAYKMHGVNYVGGTRTLVVRYDPETTYSAFLTLNTP